MFQKQHLGVNNITVTAYFQRRYIISYLLYGPGMQCLDNISGISSKEYGTSMAVLERYDPI